MTVKEQLEAIKAQKANPLPTPPVGTVVQWFDRNETDRCYAAVVTMIEGPGRLKLALMRPNAHLAHKEGVLHRSHPVHRDKHNTVTMKNGSWDYIPGQVPLKSHKDEHLRELDKREAMLVAALAQEHAAAVT